MLFVHRQAENTAEVLLRFKRVTLEVASRSPSRLLQRWVTAFALLHNHSKFRVAWVRSSQLRQLQFPSVQRHFCLFLLLLTRQARDQTAAVAVEEEEEEEQVQRGRLSAGGPSFTVFNNEESQESGRDPG